MAVELESLKKIVYVKNSTENIYSYRLMSDKHLRTYSGTRKLSIMWRKNILNTFCKL